MTVKVHQLEEALQQRPQRAGGEEIAIMHYGEVFKVREIAYATAENAEHLGINPGQMYFVINLSAGVEGA